MVVARYPTQLTFGAPRPGDIAPATVSADRAEKMLGWRAEVEFERGLEDVFADVETAASVT